MRDYERLLCLLAIHGSTICSSEGGGDGGGGDGGGTPPPKTFTQEEMSRIAAREKQQGEAAGRKAAEEAAKAALEERDEKIRQLELAGKTEAEKREIERKQREEADRKTREERERAIAKERDDAKAGEQRALERWKSDRIRTQATSALVTAKVVASATDDAVDAFQRVAKIELDEDGQITGSVIYGGKSYDKLEDAAAQFLKDKPHFAQAAGQGGGGTRTGGGQGGGRRETDKPLTDLSREDLLARTIANDKAAGRRN